MEKIILTDPMQEPNEAVLEAALGKSYKLFKNFVSLIAEQNLVLEWNYYRDTKCWLCKVLNKKKNLCWLSVWNTGFKLTFYFPERLMGGFFELDIDEEIKKAAKETKPVGKSQPVIIPVSSNKKIRDAVRILGYKKQ